MPSNRTHMITPVSPTEHPAIAGLINVITAIGLDVETSYTVADAMREGASVTTKKEGGWVTRGSSCGLGAAYLAARARGYVDKA